MSYAKCKWCGREIEDVNGSWGIREHPAGPANFCCEINEWRHEPLPQPSQEPK